MFNELYALLEGSVESINNYIAFCEECEHYSERDYWIAYLQGYKDVMQLVERLNKNSKTQKEVQNEYQNY